MADADLALRDDVEKYAEKSDYKPAGYGEDEQRRRGSVTSIHDGFFGAFTLESFKRNPNARVVTEATDSEGRPLPDQPPAEPALAMKLKERHLQMIAIGGSIGMNIYSHPVITMLISSRYWSLRRIRICSRHRWPCCINYRLRSHWNDVILHCSCSW